MTESREGYLLSLIHGNRRRIDTIPYSRYSSTDNELCGSTMTWWDTSKLDNDADNHDDGTEENGSSAAEAITKFENEAGTDEAADSIDGYDEALPVGISLDLREITGKGIRRNDARHNALIITKEQEIGRGEDGNQSSQLLSCSPPIRRYSICIVDMSHGEEKSRLLCICRHVMVEMFKL